VVSRFASSSGLVGAQRRVANIRHAITCDTYSTQYASWLVHKPKPVTTTTREKGKTVKVTTTPAYKPAPATPKGCTPQGTSG